MSLPSMTEASESMKKLQCARPRPSSACDDRPSASRNSRNASHRWPTSWPSTLSVLFSPRNFCVGIVRVFADPVHDREAAQTPGAAKICGRVVDVDPNPADFVRHSRFIGERVADDRRIGPHHQLIEVVGMGLIELLDQRDRVELTGFSKRSPTAALPPAVGPASLRFTVRNSPVCPGERPTTASES